MSSNSSGALTEVAALGGQDAFTVINPEKTFFAQSYRRHTNFAIAEQDITMENSPSGNDWTQRRITARVQRNGDLLGWCYLSVRLSALGLDSEVSLVDESIWGAGNLPATIEDARQESRIYWCNSVGHALVQDVSFEVGSQEVDKIYGEFMQIWEQLAGQPGKPLGEMIGEFDSEEDLRDFAAQTQTLYIPLPFYFARAYALHKPLIALQYHETRFQITIRARQDLIVRLRGGSDPDFRNNEIPLAEITGGAMEDAVIVANFIYLDTMERRVFAQQPHEYLITQLQFHGEESVNADTANKQIQLHFNHPVTELVFVYQESRQRTLAQGFRYFNYGVELADHLPHQDPATDALLLVDPIDTVTLRLNGHERIGTRKAKYFRMVQPWERHTKIPTRFIYNYCFSLYPEEDWAPSGGLNMSRIDNVVFRFVMADISGSGGLEYDGHIRIYGRNHNVVKIAGGMLALRHAN